MSLNNEDVQKELARLGYTPKQIDLSAYKLLTLTRLMFSKKYQAVKTHLSILQKTELTLLVTNLLFENQALAQIAIADINREANARTAKTATEEQTQNPPQAKE